MKHSIISKLIDGLCKVHQRGRDTYYEGLLAGHEPPQKLKKSRDADRIIHETALRFENKDAVKYLRSLAHDYQMNYTKLHYSFQWLTDLMFLFFNKVGSNFF